MRCEVFLVLCSLCCVYLLCKGFPSFRSRFNRLRPLAKGAKLHKIAPSGF